MCVCVSVRGSKAQCWVLDHAISSGRQLWQAAAMMLTVLTVTHCRYSPVTTESDQITPISGTIEYSERFNQPQNSQKFIRLKRWGKISVTTVGQFKMLAEK